MWVEPSFAADMSATSFLSASVLSRPHIAGELLGVLHSLLQVNRGGVDFVLLGENVNPMLKLGRVGSWVPIKEGSGPPQGVVRALGATPAWPTSGGPSPSTCLPSRASVPSARSARRVGGASCLERCLERCRRRGQKCLCLEVCWRALH